MKLNKPKDLTYIIAIILGLLALVALFINIPVITAYAFWVLFVGFVLLALGNIVKGL